MKSSGRTSIRNKSNNKSIRRKILKVSQEEQLRMNFILVKHYRGCVRVQERCFQHLIYLVKAKAVPLHAIKAFGGKEV
jgi:hypothetical protein